MGDPIVTPEAVSLDLEPATVGSRSVAILIDLCLIGTGLLLLAMAEAAFGFGGFVPDWLGIALVLLLVFALQFGYPIGFETLWRGRTPGKAAMGLRVVTVEGAPVRFRHAAVRAALGLVELTGTLGAVAVVTSLSSSRGQRLGDLTAGTLVIRERRAGGPPRAETFAPPAGYESYVRLLDVSRVDRAAYATVRDLLRRPLEASRRQALAERIADGLAPRVTPPPPTGTDAVTWLRCVAAAVQVRAGRGAPPTGVAGQGDAARAPGSGRPGGPQPGGGDGGEQPPPPPRPRSDHGSGQGRGGFAPPG